MSTEKQAYFHLMDASGDVRSILGPLREPFDSSKLRKGETYFYGEVKYEVYDFTIGSKRVDVYLDPVREAKLN